MEISPKGKTNRKWTSSDKYRNNYDLIFSKPQSTENNQEEQEVTKEVDDGDQTVDDTPTT